MLERLSIKRVDSPSTDSRQSDNAPNKHLTCSHTPFKFRHSSYLFSFLTPRSTMPRKPATKPATWESHRAELKNLYLDQGKNLGEVMTYMKENHGIVATLVSPPSFRTSNS